MKNKISVKIVNGIVWIDGEEYSIDEARNLMDQLSVALADRLKPLICLNGKAEKKQAAQSSGSSMMKNRATASQRSKNEAKKVLLKSIAGMTKKLNEYLDLKEH